MHQTGWTALVADLLIDPPRRHQRLIFDEPRRPGTDAQGQSGSHVDAAE